MIEANNYGALLRYLKHFKEAKALLLKAIPMARRVRGDGNDTTLRMQGTYADSLYEDPDATSDDLREAVTMLEDTERTARRVLGSANPTTVELNDSLQYSRAALRARDTSSSV